MYQSVPWNRCIYCLITIRRILFYFGVDVSDVKSYLYLQTTASAVTGHRRITGNYYCVLLLLAEQEVGRESGRYWVFPSHAMVYEIIGYEIIITTARRRGVWGQSESFSLHHVSISIIITSGGRNRHSLQINHAFINDQLRFVK